LPRLRKEKAACAKKGLDAQAGIEAKFASDATGHDNGDEIGRQLSGAGVLNACSTAREVTHSTKMLQSSRL
jgi:hypothetical protein